MKNFINTLFSGSNKTSMMRFLSFTCVYTGCYVAIAGLHLNRDLAQVAILSSSLVGLGLGAKYWQKKIEKELDCDKNN